MDTSPKQAPATSTRTPAPEPPAENRGEQELDYRLKGAIDQTGRYVGRLDDMTAGFAAGRNLPFIEARKAIEDSFAKQFGMRPQDYLDQHYDQRRTLMAREASLNPSHENERDHGRER